VRVHLVCPSRWLAERAQASALFRDRPVTCIPNTLPLDTYAPGPRDEARRRLGLPLDAALVGFGAAAALGDPRKGFSVLREALGVLAQRSDARRPRLVLFGRDRPLPPLPLPVHDLGILTDENRLADALRAMDVFVCPSLQENLPNTVLEALACGVPCVAFRTGGLPELIEHGENGWLSPAGSANDLAEGIRACLEPQAGRRLAAGARARVQGTFAPHLVARRHLSLYEEVTRGLAGRARAWNIAR
jgi:glycosyltransferase involved in cell wall biosynthesis